MALAVSPSSRAAGHDRRHLNEREEGVNVRIQSSPVRKRQAVFHQENYQPSASQNEIASVSSSSNSMSSDVSLTTATSEPTSHALEGETEDLLQNKHIDRRSLSKRRTKVQELISAETLSSSGPSAAPLKGDDSAWKPRKRKLQCIKEYKATASPGPNVTKRYRLDTSKSTLKHLRRCTHAPDNTKAGVICKRLQNTGKYDSTENHLFFDVTHSETTPLVSSTAGNEAFSPYVVYRWLRVRMAAGLVRSSFAFMHRLLQKGYEEAKNIMGKMDQCAFPGQFMSELLAVRSRLASIWCVYTHFLVEAGKLGIKKKCAGQPKTNVMYQDIVTFAVSVLWNARDCPLVGNHGAMTICLGRLVVSTWAISETKTGNDSAELKRKGVLERIRVAIAACWDAVDYTRADLNMFHQLSIDDTLFKQVTLHLSMVELPGKKLFNEKRSNPQSLQEEFGMISKLPLFLRGTGTALKKASYMFDDRNATRTLCSELNRWSRLETELEKTTQRSMTLTPCPSSNGKQAFMEEELPLFSSLEVKWADMDLFAVDDGGDDSNALVIWKW
jgi:hypothetical protein